MDVLDAFTPGSIGMECGVGHCVMNRLLDPLRDVDRPTVLFCGAGMSFGSVPDAKNLYLTEHENVEQRLGIEKGCIDHGDIIGTGVSARSLYVWAEKVLAQLEIRGEPVPKLKFAEELGMLDEPRWWGRAETDFRGSAPRHRVIARFAKEGIWKSIWSFNWDCILENAMDQVGLTRQSPPRFKTPWRKNHYVTHVEMRYLPSSDHDEALNIHKPHGCVRALRIARDALKSNEVAKAEALGYRLMVGAQELCDRADCDEARDNDNAFFDKLRTDVRDSFKVIVGWSIGEESLRAKFRETMSCPGQRTVIVDPNFSEGHVDVCRAAGLQQTDVLFKLETEGCPDRDDVFRWQQAAYALDQLELENDGRPILDRQQAAWRLTVEPCGSGFFLDWADEFLPTWTKLCWSAGLVVAHLFRAHQVDLERRDEYIPLNYRHVVRPDLKAAIKILGAISSQASSFDARDYPGGLFHHSTGTLVVPLPCWGEINELRALRPLVDALRSRLGYVAKVAVWPINLTAPHPELEQMLLQSVAAIMPIPSFAEPRRLRLIADLNEVAS